MRGSPQLHAPACLPLPCGSTGRENHSSPWEGSLATGWAKPAAGAPGRDSRPAAARASGHHTGSPPGLRADCQSSEGPHPEGLPGLSILPYTANTSLISFSITRRAASMPYVLAMAWMSLE